MSENGEVNANEILISDGNLATQTNYDEIESQLELESYLKFIICPILFNKFVHLIRSVYPFTENQRKSISEA